MPFLQNLQSKISKKIKYIRCDNACENIALEAECKKQGLGIIFEFTAPGTPQQNGVVERAFDTLYGSMRAMMKSANLSQGMKQDLWSECANTATDLSNLISSHKDTPHRIFYGQDPKFIDNLHIFGEMAVIKKSPKFQSKLNDKGIKVMFLGYARNHAGDVFCFLNMRTRKVVLSKDVIWLSQVYYKEEGMRSQEMQEKIEPLSAFDDVLDHEENRKITENSNQNQGPIITELEGEDEDEEATPSQDHQVKTRMATRSTVKMPREVRNLNTFYNPITKKGPEQAEYMIMTMRQGSEDLENFEDAWDHPDPKERFE